jgi:hypothetical protein
MFLHHVPGLVFGLLLLTWAGSGLLSMNPWGALESQGIEAAFKSLYGEAPEWRDVKSTLQHIRAEELPQRTVSVSSAYLDGQAMAIAIATGAEGSRQRFSAAGKIGALSEEEINAAAARLAGTSASTAWTVLEREDDYHYSHGRQHAHLPAVRIAAVGDETVNFYLDAVTGKLVNLVDADARSYRWLHYSLHRLDFQWLRARPLWNGVMLVLLAGVSLVAGTGTWMGIRRLRGRAPALTVAPPP